MFGRKIFLARAVAALLFLAGSVLIYGLSLSLPAASFEPIGPATFPRAISVIMGLLSLGTLYLSFEKPSDAAPPVGAEPGTGRDDKVGLTLASLALLIAYVGVMDWGLIGYRIATIAFLFGLGVLLLGLRPLRVAIAAVIALAISFGTHFVFTSFMYIDLPQ
jgi:hypothetical protein